MTWFAASVPTPGAAAASPVRRGVCALPFDIDRGLLGHLFNGYGRKHVKQELKAIIARLRQVDSRITLDGPRLAKDEEQVTAACQLGAPAGAIATAWSRRKGGSNELRLGGRRRAQRECVR